MRNILVLFLILGFAACDRADESAPQAPEEAEATADAKEAADPEGADTEGETETDQPKEAAVGDRQPSELAPPDDVAAPPANATTTASGLAYVTLREGSGDTPTPTSRVNVNYSGWHTNGEMFDSSYRRGQPITFPLNQVIAGWTEGVGSMKVGEWRRLWIPEELAYQGRPGMPAGMLVFDVELLGIE